MPKAIYVQRQGRERLWRTLFPRLFSAQRSQKRIRQSTVHFAFLSACREFQIDVLGKSSTSVRQVLDRAFRLLRAFPQLTNFRLLFGSDLEHKSLRKKERISCVMHRTGATPICARQLQLTYAILEERAAIPIRL